MSASKLLLGGIEVRLGMTQDEALRKLSAIYELRHMDNAPGAWFVLRKAQQMFEPIGSLTFSSDRLTFATHSLGPGLKEQTAAAVARTLYDAVEAVTAGGQSPCVVGTYDVDSLFRTVLNCPGRRLTITGSRDANVAVSIEETIGGLRIPSAVTP